MTDIVACAGQLRRYVWLIDLSSLYPCVISSFCPWQLLQVNKLPDDISSMIWKDRGVFVREMTCKYNNFFQQISGNVANTYLGMWFIDYSLFINSPACNVSVDRLLRWTYRYDILLVCFRFGNCWLMRCFSYLNANCCIDTNFKPFFGLHSFNN